MTFTFILLLLFYLASGPELFKLLVVHHLQWVKLCPEKKMTKSYPLVPVKVILLGNAAFAAINKEEVVSGHRGPQCNVSGFLVRREKFVRNRPGRGQELTEAQSGGMWPQAK